MLCYIFRSRVEYGNKICVLNEMIFFLQIYLIFTTWIFLADDFDEDGSDITVTVEPSTVMLLRDGVIEIITAKGRPVFEYQTTQIQDGILASTASVVVREKAVGRIAKTVQQTERLHWLDGSAICLHWCPFTCQIFVGYSNGGVGLVDLALSPTMVSPSKSRLGFSASRGLGMSSSRATLQKPLDLSLVANAEYTVIRSAAVHGSSISKIVTATKSGMGGAVIMLLADTNGVISTWQVFSMSSNRPAHMLWSSQAHQASVLYLDAFLHSLPSRENKTSDIFASTAILPEVIVVSACAAGVVRAWQLQDDGSLKPTAFFSASPECGPMTCCCAVPTVVIVDKSTLGDVETTSLREFHRSEFTGIDLY